MLSIIEAAVIILKENFWILKLSFLKRSQTHLIFHMNEVNHRWNLRWLFCSMN